MYLSFMIEIASTTHKFINKDQNGDYCIHEIINDHILLAAVADGVSNQPCDWKASQIACETLIAQFTLLSKYSLNERLKKSVIKANEKVIEEEGICHKMSTTLSAVCLNMKNG